MLLIVEGRNEMSGKKELWRVAREGWRKDAESSEEAWQHVVDAISAELLREDEPVAWIHGWKTDDGYKEVINYQLPLSYKAYVKHTPLYLQPAPKVSAGMPRIVCLCGSTRFKDAFDEANYQETMAGRIVLSVGFFMHASGNKHGEEIGCTPEQKAALDNLHKRKVELADDVLILNVGGYIGESTRGELNHAIALGKAVRYLEPLAAAPKGETE